MNPNKVELLSLKCVKFLGRRNNHLPLRISKSRFRSIDGEWRTCAFVPVFQCVCVDFGAESAQEQQGRAVG